MNKNCHNPRTSDDNDMKLGPLSKSGKRNSTTLKKFDDDILQENSYFSD